MNIVKVKVIKYQSDDKQLNIALRSLGKTFYVDLDSRFKVECNNMTQNKNSYHTIVNVIENGRIVGYTWFDLLEIIIEVEKE